MFSHVLLPTDGSALSETANLEGIHLAKRSNLKVTGISVMPEFPLFTLNVMMLEDTKEQFLVETRKQAEKNLATLQRAAAEEGVSCETVIEVSDHPYEAIIRTANARGCDLILMASHGRRGVQGMLLGSETHKVLTHTKIPVLVYR